MSEELQQKLRDQLWEVANKLRGNMSASDFMYFTLGFIFYKYLSEKIEAYAREEESKKKMDAAQVTGSASSYARKYALNSLFLLDDSKDADTDEYKRNEVITEKEAKRLYDLMQKKGMTEAQIKEWASQRGLKSLYQTTQQQYAEAMKELGLK